MTDQTESSIIIEASPEEVMGVVADLEKYPEWAGSIKKVEVLDFEELGMEAVWKIEVEDFPAFIVVDDKGNDFFAETAKPLTIGKRAEI